MDGVSEALPSGAWSRGERIAFGAFAAVAAGGLVFLVHPWFDATPDAAIYIATARSLAAGEGYSYLGEAFRVRPPGFSLLIAPLVAGGAGFQALNLVVGLFGVAGVLLLTAFLRPRLGMALSILVGACVWLSPAYQVLCNQVMSDVPGTTLVLGCLLLERWARAQRAASWWRHALLGAAVAAAASVRSVALLLVPAIAAARLWQAAPSGRSALRPALTEVTALALAAALLVLPWALRNRGLPDEGAALLTRIHSYPVAMWHVAPNDPTSPRVPPGEVLARVPRRAVQAASALGSRLQTRQRGDVPLYGGVEVAHAALALLLVTGIGVQLWRRREAAEIFAVLNLCVVLLYFGFSWRLLLPVYVIGLGSAAETLRDGLRHLAPERTASLAIAVAILSLVALDLPPRRGWADLRAEHERLERFADAVDREVRRDETLGATEAAFGAFLERPVYSLRPQIRRDPSPAAIEAILERYAIRVVAASSVDPRAAGVIADLRRRYGEPTRAGDALLWRVRPAADAGAQRGLPPLPGDPEGSGGLASGSLASGSR